MVFIECAYISSFEVCLFCFVRHRSFSSIIKCSSHFSLLVNCSCTVSLSKLFSWNYRLWVFISYLFLFKSYDSINLDKVLLRSQWNRCSLRAIYQFDWEIEFWSLINIIWLIDKLIFFLLCCARLIVLNCLLMSTLSHFKRLGCPLCWVSLMVDIIILVYHACFVVASSCCASVWQCDVLILVSCDCFSRTSSCCMILQCSHIGWWR